MVSPGDTLGRYKIESPIGAGGMGEVFRAWDSTLRRWVALKVVSRDQGGRAERLLAEARAVATLKHPNVVSVFDVGEVDGSAFVAMDLIVGKSLRAYVDDGSVSVETKQSWLLQVASALSAAHRAGLVHRDVKPDNVMVGEDSQAHVLDFGIAKAYGIDVIGPTQHSDEVVAPTAHLTGEGRIIGTPAYMAPEQLAGGPPSPAWDQYAFGVLAYELLTGKHPRISGLIEASGRAKSADRVAPDVPVALAEVVSRAMSPASEQRFGSMDEIVVAPGGTPSGVGAVRSLPPPGPTSTSSRSGSTHVPLVKDVDVGLHATLPIAPHPNQPVQAAPAWRRNAAYGAAIVGLLVGGIAVGVAISGKGKVTVPTTTTSAPVPSTSDWIAAPLASPSTSTSTTTSVAPPASVASATPSAIVSTAPPVTTAKPPPPPAPPKKLVIEQSTYETPQYSASFTTSMVRAVLPVVAACIRAHPPRTLPAKIGVDLELWSLGNDQGKVRDARSHEPPDLAKCLFDAYEPLAFGPGKNPNLPPGAVYVVISVDNP